MKKIIIFSLLIISIILISGCDNVDISKLSEDDINKIASQVIVCNSPYMRFSSGCCLDQNNNTICDNDEKITDEEKPIESENQSIKDEGVLSAEEVYNQNIDMFKAGPGEVRVSHILVKTEEEANEILNQLIKGSDFKELAIEKSIEPAARITGGDLGFFGKGQMIQEFEDAAFALKTVGEISEPVKTQFGWHIIRKESDIIPLADIKDVIEYCIANQKDNIRQCLLSCKKTDSEEYYCKVN